MLTPPPLPNNEDGSPGSPSLDRIFALYLIDEVPQASPFMYADNLAALITSKHFRKSLECTNLAFSQGKTSTSLSVEWL